MVTPIQLKKYGVNYSSLILLLPFLLVLSGSLLNTNFFYYPTSSAYYLFVLFVAVAALASGALLVMYRLQNVGFSKVFLMAAVWCLYIVLHGFFKGASAQVQGYYFAAFTFLCSAVCIFGHVRFSFLLLFGLILTLSLTEALLCIAQYAGVVKSNSSYFSVTGTHVNPNVTAMFMAMALPVIPVLFSGRSTNAKRVLCLLSAIIVLALFLLKCRSALIGGTLGLVVFFALKYRLLTWIKDSKNRQALILISLIGLGLMLLLAQITYNTKKASADGRKLIWKIAANMIAEKPLTGHSYGFFERNYNLAQARYITNGQATPAELENAAHVNMAYNEFLQSAAEGGLLGLLLFAAMLFALLFIPLSSITKSLNHARNKAYKNEAGSLGTDYLIVGYSGIVVFCCMSVFNFTLQAIPVLALFILYVAVINQYLPQKKYTFINRRQIFYTGLILLLAGASIIYIQYPEAAAHRQNKIAADFLKNKQPEKAISLLPDLASRLSSSESYWKNYAQALFMLKDYEGTLARITTAKQFSSGPELYLLAGACYSQLRQYPQAMLEYRQAAYLEPSRFKPRYQLMINAIKAGDTPTAVATAQGLVALKAKIPSPEVLRYKKAAKKLLAQLNISHVSQAKNQSLYAN